MTTRILRVLVVSFLCWSTTPASATGQLDVRLTVVANPDVGDLQCPAVRSTKPKPKPPAPIGATESVEVIPTEEDLGDLARAAPMPLPSIDARLVTGFGLRRTGSEIGPLRIAVWGDSHVAAGTFGDELSRALTASGAQVHTGYLPATMGRAGVRVPIRKYCTSQGWRLEPAYLSKTRALTGPSLVNLRSTVRNSYLWIDLRTANRQPTVRQVRVMYIPAATPAAVAIRVDDSPETEIRLAQVPESVAPESAAIQIEAADSMSTIKIRVIQGSIALEGFALAYENPRPVSLDVFGLPSATARGWSQADPNFLKASLRDASYDAVILEYGTNEGNVGHFDRDQYARGLREALETFRQVFPASSCLLVGPTDRGIRIKRTPAKTRGRRPASKTVAPDFLHYSRIHREITLVQAEVGSQFNCAAWDWQAFMGGLGASYRWAMSTPPLMGHDLTHLTPAGYRQTAAAIARAVGWVPQ